MAIGKLPANGALLFDVLIIGAGPSGLSVATGLVRQLHTAVVFDSGVYRNAKVQHMHNVLGWDHRDPAEFRAAGRADISNRYSTIQFQNTSVERIWRLEDGRLFQARDAAGKDWYGRKVVLATGVRDIPLDIEGYSECWTNGIYHCLFCDGYEDRGQKTVGMLAIGAVADVQRALHMARMARQLSDSVTVYTHGDPVLAEDIKNAASGSEWLRVDSRPIARFQKGEVGKTIIVHFQDQTEKEEGFLVHGPKTEVNGPFAKQLSLTLTERGDIETTQPFCETSVAGVFAVGDCGSPLKAVSPGIGAGACAAAGLAAQLQAQPVVDVRIEREL